MATNVLKNFMTTNQKVFDQVVKSVKQKKKATDKKKTEIKKHWSDMEMDAKKSEQYKPYLKLTQSLTSQKRSLL